MSPTKANLAEQNLTPIPGFLAIRYSSFCIVLDPLGWERPKLSWDQAAGKRQLPGAGFRFIPSSLCRASAIELAVRFRNSSWAENICEHVKLWRHLWFKHVKISNIFDSKLSQANGDMVESSSLPRMASAKPCLNRWVMLGGRKCWARSRKAPAPMQGEQHHLYFALQWARPAGMRQCQCDT